MKKKLQRRLMWKPWIKLYRDGQDIYDAIYYSPIEYRKLIAYLIAVCKWHPDNPDRGHGSCSLCLISDDYGGCDECPLYLLDGDCDDPKSQYRKWADTGEDEVEKRKLHADNIYKLLLKIYTKEYRKVFGKK